MKQEDIISEKDKLEDQLLAIQNAIDICEAADIPCDHLYNDYHNIEKAIEEVTNQLTATAENDIVEGEEKKEGIKEVTNDAPFLEKDKQQGGSETYPLDCSGSICSRKGNSGETEYYIMFDIRFPFPYDHPLIRRK